MPEVLQFVIGNYGIQRSNFHSKNKFVFAGKIDFGKISNAWLVSLMNDGKDLTIGTINFKRL